MDKTDFDKILTLFIIILIVSVLNLLTNLPIERFPLMKNERIEAKLSRLYKIGDKTYSLTPKGNGIKLIWGNEDCPMTALDIAKCNEILENDVSKGEDRKKELKKYETIPLFLYEDKFQIRTKRI